MKTRLTVSSRKSTSKQSGGEIHKYSLSFDISTRFAVDREKPVIGIQTLELICWLGMIQWYQLEYLGLTAFERTTVVGMTTPLTAIAAAGVLPIRGVLKQHKRLGIAIWWSFSLLSCPSFVAQWIEHLHGKRKISGLIPGLGTPFSPEYDCSLHQEESLKRSWTIGEENI